MRVELNLMCFKINIKKTDAKFQLVGAKLARDDGVVFLSPSNFLDVKIKKLAVGGECNQINWGLFGNRHEGVAPLLHQPARGYEFCSFTISDFLIKSHRVVDSPSLYR